MHHRVTWEPMTGPSDIIRSSIGGYPILPVGESWLTPFTRATSLVKFTDRFLPIPYRRGVAAYPLPLFVRYRAMMWGPPPGLS